MNSLRDKIARALAEWWQDGPDAEPWVYDMHTESADAVLVAIASDLDKVRADAVDEARRYMPFPIDPYGSFDHASLQGAYTQASNYLLDVADSHRRKAEQ